jgi:predicted transcriptional regulator
MAENGPHSFSEFLTSGMKSKGVTVDEIRSIAFIPIETVKGLMMGTIQPTPETVSRISRIIPSVSDYRPPNTKKTFEEPKKEKFGILLNKLIKSNELDIDKFAELVGIPSDIIQSYIKWNNRPTRDSYNRIISILPELESSEVFIIEKQKVMRGRGPTFRSCLGKIAKEHSTESIAIAMNTTKKKVREWLDGKSIPTEAEYTALSVFYPSIKKAPKPNIAKEPIPVVEVNQDVKNVVQENEKINRISADNVKIAIRFGSVCERISKLQSLVEDVLEIYECASALGLSTKDLEGYLKPVNRSDHSSDRLTKPAH